MKGYVLTVLAVLAFAGTAQAGTFPGEQSITADPYVTEAVAVGEGFWSARNVRPCPAPTVYVATSLNGPDMAVGESPYERAAGCEIWVIDWILQGARDRTYIGLVNLCRVIAHGLGHTADLKHTRTGVMARDFDTDDIAGAPYPCRVWARKYKPRRHA